MSGRTGEISTTLDQRLAQFETLLGARVTDLAKTLTEGGKDVVSALDQRIGEVAGTVRLRRRSSGSPRRKIGEIDQTLGTRALEVANNLDSRIGRFEDLLIGRATVTSQIETRSKAAADALDAQFEQLSEVIKVNSAEAERSLWPAGVDHHRGDPHQRGRRRAHFGRRQRGSRAPDFVGKAERDRHRCQPSHQRNDDRPLRKERRRARCDYREECAGTRQRHNGHRSGRQGNRGKGVHLHALDDGQQHRNFPHDQHQRAKRRPTWSPVRSTSSTRPRRRRSRNRSTRRQRP